MLDKSQIKIGEKASVLTSQHMQILDNIHTLADKTISPLQSIAEKLHPIVNYLILPLFAFVNAGVTFDDINPDGLVGIPLAIVFGLVAGKSLGIFSFSYLFIKMKVVTMPKHMSKRSLFGIAMLGGIGFTVALFIANLSFDLSAPNGTMMLNQAKLGVFCGSFISGILGYILLKIFAPKKN